MQAAADFATSRLLITPFLTLSLLQAFNCTRYSNTMSLYSNLATQVKSLPFVSLHPEDPAPPPTCTFREDKLVCEGVRRTWQDVLRKPWQCVPTSKRAFSTHGCRGVLSCPLLCTRSTRHTGTVVPSVSSLLGDISVRSHCSHCYKRHCSEPRIYPFEPPHNFFSHSKASS